MDGTQFLATARPEVCEQCGSRRIADIIYGLPVEIDLRAIEAGSIVMGGCILRGDDPQWRCAACNAAIHVSPSLGDQEGVTDV
jgi:hypothetical protein